MEAKIIYQNERYQVVDARDWRMGHTVDKYIPEHNAYVTIASSLTKTAAVHLARKLNNREENSK